MTLNATSEVTSLLPTRDTPVNCGWGDECCMSTVVIIYKYHTNTCKNLVWVLSGVIQKSFNPEAKPIAQDELSWVGTVPQH